MRVSRASDTSGSTSTARCSLGIASFLTDSNGTHIPNPRHARKAACKLEAAQRALSRFPRCKAKNRIRNHQRAVDKVAALHGKVRRRRLDHAHKTALTLVREHDFIAHEDLKIRNMSKAPAPKPDRDRPGVFLPHGAAVKAGLNYSIADAGWRVFLTILNAKAESAGREVMAVDPRNTSRRCPACGHIAKESRPTQEKFHPSGRGGVTGLRTNESPMPSVGENSFLIVASRVAWLSAPLLFIRFAAVSVNEAPPPVKVWYRVSSSTVMFVPAQPVPALKATGAWASRPRVTCRPPESSVVVSVMPTLSPAAWAVPDESPVRPAEASAAASSTRTTLPGRIMLKTFLGGSVGNVPSNEA